MPDIISIISKEFNLDHKIATSIINLIDEGNTIPFIARYRKEVTKGASDELLRDFYDRLINLRNYFERKDDIIRLISEQALMTDEIMNKLNDSKTLTELEDIYRPYKPKKKTRATEAIAKGLKPLADIIMSGSLEKSLKEHAEDYLTEDVQTVKDAVKGALDIFAEVISDNSDIRKEIREHMFSNTTIICTSKTQESTVYDMYYNHVEKIKDIPSHRVLAINRAESEKVISVSIDSLPEKSHEIISRHYSTNNKELSSFFELTIADSYKRLIFPSIERELRKDMTEKAQEKSIQVFGQNLKSLLMQQPLYNYVVIGFDPAFRTGCKLAVVDQTGKLLEFKTIYPTKPVEDYIKSKKVLVDFIKKYKVNLIAIGNGTASRESEEFVAKVISEENLDTNYMIVSEAGASVYSASKVGQEEYPDIDVSIRGAISIGKRVQDPLAELIKIEPQHIGVGQYQHDVNQTRLANVLDGVVEDVVNKVGVNLNTASYSLLSHVAGINKTIAKNIIAYRDENGTFKKRKELLKVARLGDKAFEQAAGFIRISNGENPLDNTAIHPENYSRTTELLNYLKYDEITSFDFQDIDNRIMKLGAIEKKSKPSSSIIKDFHSLDNLVISQPDKFDNRAYDNGVTLIANNLEIGKLTLLDIISELKKPGRDPRDESNIKPIFKKNILTIDDLKVDMIVTGRISNITDFGAFVDLGLKKDGLVHVSQISKSFIKDPNDHLKVGQNVEIKIIDLDKNKQRISLSMII